MNYRDGQLKVCSAHSTVLLSKLRTCVALLASSYQGTVYVACMGNVCYFYLQASFKESVPEIGLWVGM